MDIEPELNLSIPVKAIYEEFFCPICYDLIKECTMTHCSHNFCKDCITECLNRKKKCPFCNAETTMQQLSPNKHFDRLISLIQKEKERASKSYFENLLNAIPQNPNSTSPSESRPQLSPIEELFQTHMKRSLSSYEEYYQKLKSKYDALEEQIKKKYTDLMMERQKNQKTLTITQDDQIVVWKNECDSQLAEVSENFQNSIKMLLVSYDEFMKNFAPPPQFLPVTITVQVPSKNVQFPKVLLNPTDTAVEIRQIISQKMEKKGDPVTGFDETNLLKLVNGTQGGDGIVIPNDNVPIIQYHPEPGSSLILLGQLKCKSDAPKECFKQTFVKGANMKMDYYTCKDCKLNWVCKSCAEMCHVGHNISEYIHDHTPTWACCYCSKNGNCGIFDPKK